MYYRPTCDNFSGLRGRAPPRSLLPARAAARAAATGENPARLSQAQVVVSSTWRDTRTLGELQNLFSPDVAVQMIGVTPPWRDLEDIVYSYQRQAEVEAWLRTNRSPWDRFAVLDDRAWLFSPFYAPLLKCDPATGMDDQVEQLRDRLKAG